MKIILLICFTFLVTSQTYSNNSRKRAHWFEVDDRNSIEDIRVEIDFGRKLAASILGKYKLLKDDKINEYISTLGAGVVSYFGRPELEYHFGILDTDDVNAYACPSGHIFITKGSIKNMRNEAELVGVMVHEMAHINQKHIVKQLKLKGKDQSITSSISAFMGGSMISLMKALDKGIDSLFENGLKRKDEYEADRLAVEMMLILDYNWKNYYDYLRRIEKKGSDHAKVLYKTHPPIEKRLAQLKKVLTKNGWHKTTGKINENRFKSYVNF